MAVSPKDILKHQIETMHYIIKKMVDDISDEESMRTLGTCPNHIRWQTGHLVFTAILAGKTFGADLKPQDGWNTIFGRGAEPPNKQTEFPSMDALRTTLYEFQKEVLTALAAAPDSLLEEKREIAPGWNDSPLNAVLFLSGHDFYHCGQIAMIRHDLGRERSFG